ncbi:hypothetical protein KUTeg_008470 [Tegillarca granosa]|uniref:Uncharacterized protein n=1 Tax=Tegillarca granosa TaxID=220873 RepID=A0ABQ9F978_TEGGR|nr:hypothetical protein KUTeg_008470 [Tegillarca granosa]
MVEDVVLLHNFLQRRIGQVKESSLDGGAKYRELAELLLTQIILFNRRRSGEAQRIKVKDIGILDNQSKPNHEIMNCLSPLEQELCNSHERIEIQGKRGNKVPVMFTKEMMISMKYLISCRASANIESEYIFGKQDSSQPLREKVEEESDEEDSSEDEYVDSGNSNDSINDDKLTVTWESKRQSIGGRKMWSKEEQEAAKRQLSKYLKEKSLPGKKACEEAKRNENVLSSRTWIQIKNFIRNQNLKGNKYWSFIMNFNNDSKLKNYKHNHELNNIVLKLGKIKKKCYSSIYYIENSIIALNRLRFRAQSIVCMITSDFTCTLGTICISSRPKKESPFIKKSIKSCIVNSEKKIKCKKSSHVNLSIELVNVKFLSYMGKVLIDKERRWKLA